MKKGLLVLALLLASAGTALAAPPLVPRATQLQVKDLLLQFSASELAYAPTAAPPHYAMVNFGAARSLTSYTIADSRYPLASDKERAVWIFIEPFNGNLSACRKAPNGAMILGKMHIYFGGFAAWRCVLAPNGKLVRLTAKSSIVRGSRLGYMVAAIQRIR